MHGGVRGDLLGPEVVGALALSALGLLEAETHLFLYHSAEEAPHRMGFSVGDFAKFRKRRSTGPLKQAEDLGRFAASPAPLGLCLGSGRESL